MPQNSLKLGLVQMTSRADKAANLARAERLIDGLVAAHRPDLIALPEMFDVAGNTDGKRANAEVLAEGTAYRMLQDTARRHNVIIHGGSFHEWWKERQRIANTTVVFNPKGEQIALYRKLHLFDVVTPSGVDYKESASIAAGDEVVTYKVDPVSFRSPLRKQGSLNHMEMPAFAPGCRAGMSGEDGNIFTIGCATCYDLRFPDLFQALRLKGADIIILPSAFTRETGRAHWDILLKARAIETQCAIAAPAQTGHFKQNGKERFTFGHSAIIGQWGDTLAQMADGEGFVCAEISKQAIADVRARMPVMHHRRFSEPKLK